MARVDRIEIGIDSGGWQGSPAVISGDGLHSLSLRATDFAGNQAIGGSITVPIDVTPPNAAFLSPPDESEGWAAGTISLAGLSDDATSGIAKVEMSQDGGLNWQNVQLQGGEWQLDWDTRRVEDGTDVVMARAQDVAGNSGSSAQVILRVDNAAPLVEIPESWRLGEVASLNIDEEGIGLERVELIISHGENSIASMRYPADEVPATVAWDGRLFNGQWAAPGEYQVVAAAWDLLGNQGSDTGRVVIAAPGSAEITEILNQPEESTINDTEAITGPADLSEVSAEVSERQEEALSVTARIWIWPAIAWLGLLGTLAYAKLTDPRPSALRGLRDEIERIRSLKT